MENKLIPMVDFVLNQSVNLPFVTRFANCESYAKFLKQPLKLGFFIPCDENDVPLVEPKDYVCFINGIGGHIDVTFQEYKLYQQAKERVLFEGFENIELIKKLIKLNETIEILDDLGLNLTNSAIKKLEL
jgi:hypothetical protein